MCAFGQFRHPGMWATASELETIRDRVLNGIEPQKSAFDVLASEACCALDWTPTTVTHVNVGAYNNPKVNYDAVVDDSKAVWGQAILYYLTGNEQYARNAVAILDAHAQHFASIQGHNARLFAGWVGKNFYKGMELLKMSYPGWDAAVEERFNAMYNRVYVPLLRQMNPTGANWDFYMMESLMTAAIFQENRAWFDECLEIWSTLFPGYIAPNGECAETCRDLGHAWMGLSGAVRVAEIAWKQGIDLYGSHDNRLLTGLEFHAKYTLSKGGVCRECGQYEGFGLDTFSKANGQVVMLNMSNRNERAMGWETAYNHYHNRLGLEMPLSVQVIMETRYHGLLRWGDGPCDLFHAAREVEIHVSPKMPPPVARASSGLDDVTYQATNTLDGEPGACWSTCKAPVWSSIRGLGKRFLSKGIWHAHSRLEGTGPELYGDGPLLSRRGWRNCSQTTISWH